MNAVAIHLWQSTWFAVFAALLVFWLRKESATTTRPGTNTILVTHSTNIEGAYPKEGAAVDSGESLIFRPDGRGGAAFVARVKITEWPRFGG